VLVNDPCDRVKTFSGADEGQHRFRDTILI
jgi:hypothetical protein